ncbi:hypothetical protein ACWGID_07350 [Kribbella sp. NPDC054772]
MAGTADQQASGPPVRASDTAGAIYGTIAAMAVIAGGAEQLSADRLLAVTVGTLGVFWLAHVYADALAHHLRGARRLEWKAIRAAMAEEWPLLTGPVPCLVVISIAAIGNLDLERSVRVALWVGVAQLFTWGLAFARRQRWGWPVAVTAGTLNATCGVVIVVLEVLIH